MSEAHKFVTVRGGNCPLVLTAPHGGTSSYLNSKEVLKERPDKPGICKLSDLKTMELLHSIDEHIAIETGGLRPHIVSLRCHRKYIDANRNYRVEADAAFHAECGLAKGIYTLYHESIEKAIEEASAGSPQGRVLHLDIHGMKPYADYIVAGTRNNTTCDRELAEKEYTGFLYHLRQQFPQGVLPAREGGDVARYKGGYTVQRHGDGGTGGRCDAIQLEFGAFLRLKRQREEVARNVATAASNTLFPMRSFLCALLHKHGTHVKWDEQATERVVAKLKRIHCFAPNDLRNKMKKGGVTSINSSLRFLGEKQFKKTTLAVMSSMLGVVSDAPLSSLVPLTRKEQQGSVAGAECNSATILCSSGSNNMGVVRRIFFHHGDEEGLEFVRRVMHESKSDGSVGSGRNDDDNDASTGDTGTADEEVGALLSSTIFFVPPTPGTGADASTTASKDWNKEVSAEQGMLRPLGPCGQPIVSIVRTEQQQEGEKDGDGDDDDDDDGGGDEYHHQHHHQQQQEEEGGTCLTLPGKSTFGVLFKEWRRRFVDSRENKRLSLQNISLGGAGGAAATHVVAWVSVDTTSQQTLTTSVRE